MPTSVSRRCLLPVAALLLATLAGCTPWGTWPSYGSAGVASPVLTPVPELMSDAIWWVYNRYDMTGPIIVNLPAGTDEKGYEKVIAGLGGPGSARPMTTVGEPAIMVKEVRVRTVDAEVDVYHPTADGTYALSRISFKQNLFKGWAVVGHHRWRFDVEQDVPGPNYQSPEMWAEVSDDGTAP